MSKTILGVFAHPDDEVMCSGLLMQSIEDGYEVHLISATSGGKGKFRNKKYKGPRHIEIKEVRSKEYKEVNKALCTSSHQILGYDDGQSDAWNEEQLIKDLLQAFMMIKPDYVITFPLNGLNGHPDHKKISKLTTHAVNQYVSTRLVQLIYQSTPPKTWLDKKLWMVPKGIKHTLMTKFSIVDNQANIMIELSAKVSKRKVVLPLLHETQFPDHKGRYYYMPKFIFKRISRYEHYKSVNQYESLPFIDVKGVCEC